MSSTLLLKLTIADLLNLILTEIPKSQWQLVEDKSSMNIIWYKGTFKYYVEVLETS